MKNGMENIEETIVNDGVDNGIEKTVSEEDTTDVKSCFAEECKRPEGEESESGADMAQDTTQTLQEDQDKGKKDLEKYERSIFSAIQKGRTIGEALKAILNRKLYKLKGYKSFRRYCLEHLGITGTHAYRMIDHHTTCTLLGVPPEAVPEKTTRVLSSLRATEAEKRILWQKATDRSFGGCPTTEAVRHCVAEFKRAPNANPEHDPDEVYIKKWGKYVSRENLEFELLNQTQNAIDLIQLTSVVNEYLTAEARERLKQECIARLDGVFGVIE